eukprot:403371910
MSEWNNYAVSFKDKKMRIHINGLQVAEGNMNATNLPSDSQYCVLGNSLQTTNPMHIQMRHFMFSNIGFTSNQNITLRIRSNLLPNDTSTLAYFKFHKDFNNQETYLYNSTLNMTVSNVQIQMSADAEQVCYCTKPSPNYLKISSAFKLRQLDMTPFNEILNQAGATLNFTIFPQLMSNTNDLAFMGIDKLFDVVLSGQGQRIRLDLYNSSGVVQQQLLFENYLFRFNFWTNYTIQVLQDKAVLYVDGLLIRSLNHQVTLPTKNSPKLNIAQQTTSSLTFLLNQVIVIAESLPRRIIFNRTFTQNLLMPTFQNQNVTSGKLVFEANNQYCSIRELYNPQDYIAVGGLCKSNRLVSGFKNSSSNPTNTAVSVNIKSSLSVMTIEMWVKDQSVLTSSSKITQVLFENTNDGKNIHGQISINPSTVEGQRIFRITPQTTSAPARNISLQITNSQNSWVHLAIVSNQTNLRMLLFNTKNQVLSNAVNNSLILSSITANGGILNTSIGSSLNGANKFMGLIREFRVYASARNQQQIELERYSSAYKSIGRNLAGSNALINSFRLNDGLDYQNMYDSMMITPTSLSARQFDEKSLNESSYTWDTDEDLVVCSDGYFFDGQCCKQVDITNGLVDFQFIYSASKSRIQLNLVKSANLNQALFKSIYADFKLVSIGNNFNQALTTAQLRPLFTKNETQSYEISSQLVNPQYFNLTVQASIYSIFDSRVIYINRTLSLLCPQFILTVNNQSVSSDDNYIVSNRTNHLIRVRANQTSFKCFNSFNQQTQDLQIQKVAWSHNQTKFTFSQMFDTSTDSFTITQKFNVSGLSKTRVTAKITYNNTMVVEQYLDLDYQNIYIENGFTSAQVIRNQVIDKPTTISFGSSFLFPNVDQSQSLIYFANCPSEIFISADQYNQLCTFGNTADFFLDTFLFDNFNIRLGKKYLFEFIVAVEGSHLMKPLQITVTYYRDGSDRDLCPAVVYRNDYIYDKVNDANLEMFPDAYLYCNGIFYEYQSVAWVVTDQVSKKVIANALSFNSDNPLSVYLRNDNAVVKGIQGGSMLILNSTFQTKVANQTAYTGATKTIANQVGQVTFKQVPFIPRIQMSNFGKQVITDGKIGFLDPNVTLNASQSYDPDNATAALWFLWTCPREVKNCTANQFGQRNNSFIIDYMFRFRNGLLYNKNYTFTVSVWSRDNTFKSQQQLSYNVSFLQPKSSDVNYGMQNTTCEQIDFDQSDRLIRSNSTYNRIIYFTRANYTNINFTVSSKLDNGTIAQKSSCGQGNVTSVLIIAYLGEGAQNPLSNPYVIYNNTAFSATNNRNFQSLISFKGYNELEDLSSDKIYNMTVYQIIQRQGSNRTFVNVINLFLQKARAGLEIIMDTSKVLDQYEDLVIDASNTIDAETKLKATQVTYTWTCPNSSQSCGSVSGSILSITYQDRVNNFMNNLNQEYMFSVRAYDKQNKVSDLYYFRLYISAKSDYSECLSINLMGSVFMQNFLDQNNTVRLEYNQYSNTTFELQTKLNCINSKLLAPVYSSQNDLSNNQMYFSSSQQRLTIIAQQLQKLVPDQIYTILVAQPIQMGLDSLSYNKSTYINVVVNKPDLIAKIQGNSVVIDGTDTALILNGSASIDPLSQNYTCSWKCPTAFNQQLCQNQGCLLNITMIDLKASFNDVVIYAGLLDKLYNFELKITSSDYERIAEVTKGIYLSSYMDEQYVDNSFQHCGVKLKSNQGVFEVDRINQYELDCQNDNDTQILLDKGLIWNASGLNSSTDYYQQNNVLYIRPYVSTRINQANLNITLSLNQTQSRRILQETPDDGNTTLNSTTPQAKQLKLTYSELVVIRRDNILQMGSIQVDPNPLNSTVNSIYITNYTFTFTDFFLETISSTILYFQLRIYSPVKKDQVILIPLKQFNEQNILKYYKSLQLPQFSQIMFDFYDGALQYVGSYDLSDQQILKNATIGSYQFQEFDRRLFPITQKTQDDYPSTSQGQLLIEQDYYQIDLLVDMIQGGRVFSAVDIILNNYAQKILAYIRNSFVSQLSYFDASYSLEYADARYNLQKQVLVILDSLIQTGSQIEKRVLNMLDVLQAAVSDYDALLDYSEDPELIRQIVLNIQSKLKVQLVATNIANKQSYLDQLVNITTTVQQNDIKKANDTQSQITMINSETQSRIIYRVLDGDTKQIAITNNLNSRETIKFDDPTVLANLGISSLFVSFDKDANKSSAVMTSIDITAFDKNQSLVQLQFDDQVQSFFEINFQVNNTVKLFCVYVDNQTQQYSTKGIKTIYNLNEDMVSCQSSHLSQFSVISQKVDKNSTDGGGGGVIINPNNTNNQTNNNGTTEPKNNQTQKDESNEKYYKENSGSYIAAIIVTSVVTFLTLSIGCCHKYSFDTSRYKIETKAKYPFAKVLWASLKVYHPLISSMATLKYPNLAIPKFYHILTLWIYVFGLAFWSIVIFISQHDSIIQMGRFLIVFGIIFEILSVFVRPVYSYMVYGLYHSNTDTNTYIDEQKKSGQNGNEQRQGYGNRNNNATTNLENNQDQTRAQQYGRSSMGPDSQSRLKSQNNSHKQRDIRMQDFDQFEGGSDESAEFDDEELDLSSHMDQQQNNSYVHQGNTDTQDNIKNVIRQVHEEEKLQSGRPNNKNIDNIHASTIGKKHQEALDIHIDEDDDSDSMDSINLTEQNQVSPRQEKNDPTQYQRNQPQIIVSPITTNKKQNSNGSTGSNGMSSTKKLSSGKNQNANQMLMEYGHPSAQREKSKGKNEVDFIDKNGPHNNFMIRENSDYYAEEIDRLPNEPEPEIIPYGSIIGQNNIKQNRNDNIIEIRDVEVQIEDQAHNYKGTRLILALVQLFILLVEMIITYALMREIGPREELIRWIIGISIIALVLVLVIDFLRILIFACIYAGKQPNYRSVRCAAFIFLGNIHFTALKSLQMEIQL